MNDSINQPSLSSTCYLLGLLVVLILSSCAVQDRVSSVVYEDLYRIDQGYSHDAFARQHSPDSSYVQFRLRTGHLLHKRKDKDSPFIVDVRISAVTVTNTQGVSDTIVYHFSKNYDEVSDELVYGRFSIPMNDTIGYELRVFLLDNYNNKESRFIEFYSADGRDDRFNSILVNGLPSRFCACDEGDELLFFPYGWGMGTAEVKTYEVEQGLAPPPFSINSFPSPVSSLLDTWQLNYDGGISMSCPSGQLLVLDQPSLNTRLQIPVFNSAYPRVSGHREMINALKFITTSNEHREMTQSDDPRKVIEKFWIDCGGSKERARVLIEQYYARVEEANTYFTETSQGWKTDRGLIHIVYGPPSRVMRYPDREIWYYGTDNSDNSLKMTFYRDDRYIMDRSLDYRQSWYLTVDSWRNGRTINP